VAAGRRFRPVYGRSMAVCQSKRQRPATATGGTRETLRALHQRGAGPC
jgi:hypothetical protein